MESKKWTQSLTIWVNTLVFFLPDIAIALQQLVDMKVVEGANQIAIVIKLIAVINILIRVFKTNQPIEH
jgi:uncharacterized membrane protein YhaH (DUF805 family)